MQACVAGGVYGLVIRRRIFPSNLRPTHSQIYLGKMSRFSTTSDVRFTRTSQFLMFCSQLLTTECCSTTEAPTRPSHSGGQRSSVIGSTWRHHVQLYASCKMLTRAPWLFIARMAVFHLGVRVATQRQSCVLGLGLDKGRSQPFRFTRLSAGENGTRPCNLFGTTTVPRDVNCVLRNIKIFVVYCPAFGSTQLCTWWFSEGSEHELCKFLSVFVSTYLILFPTKITTCLASPFSGRRIDNCRV